MHRGGSRKLYLHTSSMAAPAWKTQTERITGCCTSSPLGTPNSRGALQAMSRPPTLTRSPFSSPPQHQHAPQHLHQHRTNNQHPPHPGEPEWTLLDERAQSLGRTRSLSGEGFYRAHHQQQHHHHHHHTSPTPRIKQEQHSSSFPGQRDLRGDTERQTGLDTAWLAEAAIQQRYKQRLEEAEQQVAYWQARAKEGEQAMLKYKTECVSLRCQMSAQQCTLTSLDDMLASISTRLEDIGGRMGVWRPAAPVEEPAAAGGGGGPRSDDERTHPLAHNAHIDVADGGGRVSSSPSVNRPAVLTCIEHVLQEMERWCSAVHGGGSKSVIKDGLISFRTFNAGDIALFFPTPSGDYLAFNVGCPHHYLSEESKTMIGQDKHFRKYYVLGRITRIVRSKVPRGAGLSRGSPQSSPTTAPMLTNGSAESHYNLQEGTTYFVAHVEPVADEGGSSPPTATRPSSSLERRFSDLRL